MKFLTAAIALFYFASTIAAAPYGIKGQQQAATLYSNVHQFPNNQVTNLGGINALVENGNDNILSNPSFEHLTSASSWTDNGTATGVGTSVAVIAGKKAFAYLPIAQTINLTQSSTLYASQFADGVQGLAMVRIKTDAALKVCSIQAGTVSTTNCVTTNTDNKWGLYKVPFILGATSNGISISSTGASVSGTVSVDDAFVGAVDLKQDVNNIGPWNTYTPTVTGLTNSTANGKWRQVGTNMEINFRIVLTGTPATTTGVSVSIPAGYTIDTLAGVIDTNLGALGFGHIFKSSTNAHYTIQGLFTGSTVLLTYQSALTGQVTGVTNTAPAVLAINDTIDGTFTVPITQFSGATSVYSTPNITNADRIGEIIQTTNSVAPNGFISAMNKSIGQTGSGANFTGNSYFALYEHIWNLAGLTTTSGDVYRISSAKGTTASADFAANKTITIDYETNAPFIRGKAAAASIGAYAADTLASHNHRLPYGPNTTGTLLALNQLYNRILSLTGYDGATENTGGSETRPKNVSLFMYIRYTSDSQLIIGSFSGLQTCTDTLACTDTFSARVNTAGVVSEENVNWISGNATIATNYSLTYTSIGLTQPLNCTATADNIGRSVRVLTTSSTSVVVTVFNTLSQVAVTDTGFWIICQKQGADYIGKTAMAVASDQNVRSIGSTNVDIQSVYFGSGADCATTFTSGSATICNRVGTKITSVQYISTGTIQVNGLDGTKYNCIGSGAGPSGAAPYTSWLHNRPASSSSFVYMNKGSVAGTLADGSYNLIQCIGIP